MLRAAKQVMTAGGLVECAVQGTGEQAGEQRSENW